MVEAWLAYSGLFYFILAIAIFLDLINISLYVLHIINEIRYLHTGIRKRVPSAAPVAATIFYFMFLPYGIFVNASLGKPFFPISMELKVGLLFLVGHIVLHVWFIIFCRLLVGFSRRRNYPGN